MFIPTEDDIQTAIEIAQREIPEAVGYRVLIKPLPVAAGFKADDMDKYEALAAAGFDLNNKDEAERETKGSDRGIVCSVGPGAYKGDHLEAREPWVSEGDIAVFHRYVGHTVQIPEGSENTYRICNDEDVFGRYKGNLSE